MGLFGSNNKNQVVNTNLEFNTIVVSKYALSPNVIIKTLQLGAFFLLMRSKHKGAECSIDTTLKTFEIPEEFEMTEILALLKIYEFKAMHIFIDEEHYIDINLDLIEINGELELYEDCKNTLRQVEKYKSDFTAFSFNFNQYSEKLWNAFEEQLYDALISIGNKYIKFGYFLVYDSDLDETEVATKEQYDEIKNKEYILLRGKINKDKNVIMDYKSRQIIATGFDELERLNLLDTLKYVEETEEATE